MLEYHPHGWLKVGDLQRARAAHAVVSIGSQELPCLASGELFKEIMKMAIQRHPVENLKYDKISKPDQT